MSAQDSLCIWFHDKRVAASGDVELWRWRMGTLGAASGHVLEVGARAGANLSCYGAGLESLTVTEWRRSMFRRLSRRVAGATAATLALRAPVEDLPFNDGTFDQVVSTFSLCRADDQRRALREIHRVLRPGGQLAFLEHVRAADARHARCQDGWNGLHRVVVGCDCDRPTVESIRTAGFHVTELRHLRAGQLSGLLFPVAGVANVIAGRRYLSRAEPRILP